jgi:hypothetical protein
LELAKTLETFSAGVGNLCVVKRQPLELAHVLEVLKAGIGDLGGPKIQQLELGETFKMLHGGVRGSRSVKSYGMYRIEEVIPQQTSQKRLPWLRVRQKIAFSIVLPAVKYPST